MRRPQQRDSLGRVQAQLSDRPSLAAAIDLVPMARAVDFVLHGSIHGHPLLEHVQNYGVECYER